MAWYDEAVFYHIYPLGLTGAPKENSYQENSHRLMELIPWVHHLQDMGINGLYIGPLFEAVGHGYETTDYRKVDGRLGTNEDLTNFVKECHACGIRVILDGVFNHTGRDFFAFKDIQQNRENSRYLNWYCNVNFYGNNEYNDGFCYDNWGGYNLMAKLNQRNPEVQNYIYDTIRFWVSEFDIDGLRLDAADVLDFDFMKGLRHVAEEVKEDFWLMGEVIHGEYRRWVNDETLHSVTNYALHKALYSSHNEHNYYEIAHTVKYVSGSVDPRLLYNFVDNHDVERIYEKLNNKQHWTPVHILLFGLPGVPSIYYGSEFAVRGKKERFSDDTIRPKLNLDELMKAENPYYDITKAIVNVYRQEKALAYGEYKELYLRNGQYAFLRGDVIVAVNNEDSPVTLQLPCEDGEYIGALHGSKNVAKDGMLEIELPANDGEFLIPSVRSKKSFEPLKAVIKPEVKKEKQKADEKQKIAEKKKVSAADLSKPYEEMSVEELQAAILAKMENNGPVTDRMRQDVEENVYRDSLLNWVKSFR